MIRILCVCGNGMGTSTILKITIRNICMDLGIDAQVESCSAGEATIYVMQTDFIITTPEWASMIMIPPHVKVATTLNLIDKETIQKIIFDTCREHFPDELTTA